MFDTGCTLWRLPHSFLTTVTRFGNFHPDFRRQLDTLATRRAQSLQSARHGPRTQKFTLHLMCAPQKCNLDLISRLSARRAQSPKGSPRAGEIFISLHL